jgi:hypothetical protein
MPNESELWKNMVLHGQEFVERLERCAGLGYTPFKPNCTYHMWVDKNCVYTACRGMAGRCGGLFVDDTYIKWVVTLLAVD